MARRLLFLGVLLTLILGCDEQDKKTVKYGSAVFAMAPFSDLAFTNNATEYATPEYFGIKLISVYLSSTRDESGHSPSESTIYINPSCLVPVGEGDGTKSVTVDKEAHIGRCDIEGGGTSSNTTSDTIDLVVRDYVDLAASEEEINDAIAAQGFQVTVGTYKYAVVTLGGASGGTGVGEQTDVDGTYEPGSVPNIKYKHPDMSEAKTFRKFATFNTELPETLEVTENKKVIVRVNYDPSKLMSVSDATNSDDCVQEGSVEYCVHLPEFSVNVEEVDSF